MTTFLIKIHTTYDYTIEVRARNLNGALEKAENSEGKVVAEKDTYELIDFCKIPSKRYCKPEEDDDNPPVNCS